MQRVHGPRICSRRLLLSEVRCLQFWSVGVRDNKWQEKQRILSSRSRPQSLRTCQLQNLLIHILFDLIKNIHFPFLYCIIQAWKLWTEGNPRDFVDASILNRESLAVVRCIQVGLLCVQQRPEDRPAMSNVVVMLDSEHPILDQPKQPGFYTQRTMFDTDSSSTGKIPNTSNEITVTLLHGRQILFMGGASFKYSFVIYVQYNVQLIKNEIRKRIGKQTKYSSNWLVSKYI